MSRIDDRVSNASDIAALAVAAAAVLLVLLLHLLPALLAGLLVYELVHIVADRLPIARIRSGQAKLVAVAILAVGIVLFLTSAVAGIIVFIRSEAGSLPALLQKMAD